MRRKIISMFFAAVIVSVMCSVCAYAESAIVTANGVNFRSGPGTNYYVIATLDRGTSVEVLDRSNGSWVAVSCGGYNGFISSAYLSVTQNNQAIVPDFSFDYGYNGGYNNGYNSGAGMVIVPSPGSGTAAPGTATVNPGTGSTGSSYTGYINAMYVRFRSGPGSNYSVIGTYNSGKPVTIVAAADEWTACYIDGQMGYVYSSYISTGSSNNAGGSTGTGNNGGIVVVPDTPSAILPQPNGGAVVTPTPTYAPVVTPQPTYAPVVVVTPQPTYAPVVVVTPQPTYAPIVTPAPVTTPSAVVTPNNSTANSANATGYIAGSYVRFRSGPGTNYTILGTYNTGKPLVAHSRTSNGWLLCTIDGVNGYVNENYVLITSNPSSSGGSSSGSTGSGNGNTGNSGSGIVVVQPVVTPSPTPNTTSSTTAYIVGNNVRFRSAPSMSSSILAELFYGNTVTLHGVQDGWAVVTYNGKTGYVYAQYVKQGSYGSYNTGSGTVSGGSASSGSSGSTGNTATRYGTGQDVANYAMQFVGSNYSWGGSSPSTGFDCSGLVYYVYKQFGYTLNRVAQDQAANGVHVDPGAIQPGDVLCFYSGSSYIGHVGIYIGDGKFVHASNSTTGVIISELAGYYSNRGFEARRIIN